MSQESKCPECSSQSIYQDGNLWVCAECSHEWMEQLAQKGPEKTEPESLGTRDAFGNALTTGDAVTVIKDLKVKGSSAVVKVGTKVKNIRIVDSSDGHNIACKIDGIGAMNLKSEFVKKV